MACTTFYDNGPRFLITNAILGLYHVACGFLLGFMEVHWIGCWFALCMLVSGILNFIGFRKSYRDTRRFGDILGFIICFSCGNFWAALLLCAPKYGGDQTLKSLMTPFSFLLSGLFMSWLTYWHKKVVCPRDVTDPSHIMNQQYPRRFKAFKYTLGPMASFVYGMAASRLRAGRVPASYIESILGFCTAALMFALYYRKYRQSGWGSVITLFWNILVGLLLVVSFFYYGFLAHKPEEHMQLGISMMVCLTYFVFFTIAFLFKICLLKEPFHLNFSPAPVESTKSQNSIVVGPTPTRNRDLEANTYGVNHLEADSAARKLGFNDPDLVTRSNTQATGPSVDGDADYRNRI